MLTLYSGQRVKRVRGMVRAICMAHTCSWTSATPNSGTPRWQTPAGSLLTGQQLRSVGGFDSGASCCRLVPSAGPWGRWRTCSVSGAQHCGFVRFSVARHVKPLWDWEDHLPLSKWTRVDCFWVNSSCSQRLNFTVGWIVDDFGETLQCWHSFREV